MTGRNRGSFLKAEEEGVKYHTGVGGSSCISLEDSAVFLPSCRLGCTGSFPWWVRVFAPTQHIPASLQRLQLCTNHQEVSNYTIWEENTYLTRLLKMRCLKYCNLIDLPPPFLPDLVAFCENERTIRSANVFFYMPQGSNTDRVVTASRLWIQPSGLPHRSITDLPLLAVPSSGVVTANHPPHLALSSLELPPCSLWWPFAKGVDSATAFLETLKEDGNCFVFLLHLTYLPVVDTFQTNRSHGGATKL